MTTALKELTAEVEQRLHQLKYDPHTITVYHRFWNRVADFMEDNGQPEFNETIADEYCRNVYGCPLTELSGTAKDCRRAIAVLLEFQKSGVIYRRQQSKKHIFSDCYQPATGEFMSIIELTKARTTYRQFRFRLEAFLGYLEGNGCTDFQELNKQIILAYWNTRSHLCRNTQSFDAYALRKFFDFLYEHGYTAIDNSVFIPNIRGSHKGQIPSSYTTGEIVTLLSGIDRANPAGKRDYAIMLLAVRYGMRVGDIRSLKLSDIDWSKSSFSFSQSKTDELVTLPLLDDVATALIDYFRDGRPETECRYIFIRHIAPYEAFGEDNNLHHIIGKYMRFAGFTDFHHRKHGLHSMRHSIAGNMLDQGVPMPTVSEILGHSSTESTMIYTKIGTRQLKSCALEVE